jgi:hypothetical protein
MAYNEEFLLQEHKNKILTAVSSAEVRYLIIWLMDEAGYFKTSFHGENTNISAYKTGQKDLINLLLDKIKEIDSDYCLHIFKEYFEMQAHFIKLNTTE